MSTSDSTIKGKWDELAGKAKQAFGEATNDQSTANSGAGQEVKGNAEQSWGAVKEAVHDTGERNQPATEQSEHNVRSSVTSAATNVKERIENAADDFKNR